MRTCLASTLVLMVTAFVVGCGHPGAPLAPSLQLPQPVTDLHAVRKGDRVTLTWTVPTRTTDDDIQRQLGITRICREVVSAAEALKPVEPGGTPCAKPIAELPPAALNSAPVVVKGETREMASMTDTLSPDLLSPVGQNFVRYSVEVRNERGKSAGASTAVVVPLLRLEPVHDFRAVMTATGPVLSWASGNDFHFVIVRSEENGAVQRFENPALTLDAATSRMTFTDPKFEWEKAYRYSVAPIASRAADANAPGFSFEGEDSPIATVITHDVFPPVVPTGLQAVFSDLGIVHGIDLTWNADTEDDLAGYILYRRIQGTTEWKRLNTELVKTPVFRDVTDLAPGSILEYAVSALDVRGNESARSAITTEKVPQ